MRKSLSPYRSIIYQYWGGRTRTCNFLINSQAVCQLTYTPSVSLSNGTPDEPAGNIATPVHARKSAYRTAPRYRSSHASVSFISSTLGTSCPPSYTMYLFCAAGVPSHRTNGF